MRKKSIAIFFVAAALLCHAAAVSGSLDDAVRAAGSDLTVFCPAADPADIQWTALSYLNQTYGVQVYIAVLEKSPAYAAKVTASADGQFHLAEIGTGVEFAADNLADSILAVLFDAGYPDLAVFGASSSDSALVGSILARIRQRAEDDSLRTSNQTVIYVREPDGGPADVVLNDAELYKRYGDKMAHLSQSFGASGPESYIPEQFRWYSRLNLPDTAGVSGEFLAGLEPFRLPGLLRERLPDSPERDNVLGRIDSYISNIQAAQKPWVDGADRLAYIAAANEDITRIAGRCHPESMGHMSETGLCDRIMSLRKRAYSALAEAVGIDWEGHLEIRDTPFGKTGKLSLDLTVTGPNAIELSYFKFLPRGKDPIVIDSISKTIEPHQRFYREYPVDISDIDVRTETGDSLLFAVETIIDRVSLSLYLPYRQFADRDVGLTFLPGYAFLEPFTEGELTALAQPFDWQLRITKPYASELTGTITIDNPDGIVVGSFDEYVFMPVGITSKYVDIHLAAGRSIGYDLRTVKATLDVGGQTVARTDADVRVVRCKIPDTRDIAFLPDPEGRLEDFLRMTRASFQPLTVRGLMRAPLEAYDMVVIGSDADVYYDVLRGTRDRLRDFVDDGGDVVIFGQGFDWPHDLFEFPIYPARTSADKRLHFAHQDHSLLNFPYEIDTDNLTRGISGTMSLHPAIIDGGAEIVSAGELGSYLQVVKIGDGYVVYCGLPLFKMAADLNVEAIHLLANILNVGYGE